MMLHDVMIHDLTVSYGEKTVIDSLSAKFAAGTLTALVGESGRGKTTLLSAISGLLPYTGKIETGGERISVAFQTPRLLPWRTVLENVILPIKDEKDAEETAKKLLLSLGLADAESLYPDELSGGMAVRASLARALAYTHRGGILLLDEPTRELDAESRARVISVIKEYRGVCTVIASTHDGELAENADLVLEI